MPMPHEHSCRLKESNGQKTRRANGEREHEGKKYDVIYQRTGPKADDPWEEQAYRYPKETWTSAQARAHCKAHKGILFEPAAEREEARASDAEPDEACCGAASPPTDLVTVRYEHVLQYVAQQAWAILPAKMEAILGVLAHRAAGHRFTAEEIRAQIGERVPSAQTTRGTIAILPLRGVIAHRIGSMTEASGGIAAERFAAAVRLLAADETVEAILLDVDSPGGTIAGVPEAAQAVFDAREAKPILAVANSEMASAAYWIASQAHELIAIPSVFDPVIGSIGIFMVHKDLSAALEQAGIKITLISAGKHKLDGNPFGPLSEEQQAEAQAMVDAAYDRFVNDVARGRGVTPAVVRTGFGEGRGLPAVDAKAAGLIDRIATMEATIKRLAGGRRAPVSSRAGAQAALPLESSASPEKSEGPELPPDVVDPVERAALDAQQAADQEAADRDAIALVIALGR